MSQNQNITNSDPNPDGDDAIAALAQERTEALNAEASASPEDPPPAADQRPQAERSAEEPRSERVDPKHLEQLEQRDRKAQEWERAYKAVLKEKELATALSGRALVPGGAAQLIKLWRDDLEVIDENGRTRVTARDGRGVEQAVAAWLASPEYAHFLRPSSMGGTTPRGDSRTARPGAPPSPPNNLGEAVLRRWRQEAAATPANGDDAIGLGRRSS